MNKIHTFIHNFFIEKEVDKIASTLGKLMFSSFLLQKSALESPQFESGLFPLKTSGQSQIG